MLMHERFQKIINHFTEELHQLFGRELVSVILYGSAVTEDFHPKRSDLNFLVVLTPEGLERIRMVQKYLSRWQRQRILFPLFVTKEFIKNSLDSFPLEFFNMKFAYRVLYGEDVLASIDIRNEDLRLQCERELKGKLLHLRQSYLFTRGKVRALRDLIIQSIGIFTLVFRALLFLSGKPIPKTRVETITDACSEFHLDLALFQSLLTVREKKGVFTKDELQDFIERYIVEIERLSQSVEEMKFLEESKNK